MRGARTLLAASKDRAKTRDQTCSRAEGSGVPVNRWTWNTFACFHIVSALLIASWIVPATRSLWDVLDLSVFRALNGLLALGDGWLVFWAAANHRAVDLISGSLCAAVILWWVWGQPREIQNRRAAALGALTVPLLVIPFTTHLLIRLVFKAQRHSPTLVVDDALLFSKLLPQFETKDISIYSFPGDHSFILFSVTFFFWFYAPRKFFLAILALAIIFSLPRLVGGAHWLTDDVIGGIAPALLVIAWVCATPFAYQMSRLFLPIINTIVGFIPERLWIPDYSATGMPDDSARPSKRR